MATSGMKSETIQATGKMKPCHRPSRKPGAWGATASWLWVAAQAASNIGSSSAKESTKAAEGDARKPDPGLAAVLLAATPRSAAARAEGNKARVFPPRGE